MHNAKLTEQLMRLILWCIALLVAVVPIAMFYELLTQGLSHLSWTFIFSEPLKSGREGGVAPILFSTALILIICLSVVIPMGLSCALYITEICDRNSVIGKWLSHSLDILGGVPSIVFGLFGYVFFAQVLSLGFSILTGGLTLACMALPLFIRLCEQALLNSPVSYRQAAQALNLSHSGYILHILLPSASSGIAAATIIATGRALAETAVLIFTAGYASRYPESIMDSGRALSVHIYDLAMNVAGGTAPAAATALVLVTLLIIINISARYFSKRWLPS